MEKNPIYPWIIKFSKNVSRCTYIHTSVSIFPLQNDNSEGEILKFSGRTNKFPKDSLTCCTTQSWALWSTRTPSPSPSDASGPPWRTSRPTWRRCRTPRFPVPRDNRTSTDIRLRAPMRTHCAFKSYSNGSGVVRRCNAVVGCCWFSSYLIGMWRGMERSGATVITSC